MENQMETIKVEMWSPRLGFLTLRVPFGGGFPTRRPISAFWRVPNKKA